MTLIHPIVRRFHYYEGYDNDNPALEDCSLGWLRAE
jgi:hypothetical protein